MTANPSLYDRFRAGARPAMVQNRAVAFLCTATVLANGLSAERNFRTTCSRSHLQQVQVIDMAESRGIARRCAAARRTLLSMFEGSNPIAPALACWRLACGSHSKYWRRERHSNPRRAFDPYTLSRADHESMAVYTIMIFAFFLASLSTPVHSRLHTTIRTVPYGQLCHFRAFCLGFRFL